jgi:hypothetical protein
VSDAISELVLLVEEADEGGYVARALGESVFTQADTDEPLGACRFNRP